jgi:hypothetical protein
MSKLKTEKKFVSRKLSLNRERLRTPSVESLDAVNPYRFVLTQFVVRPAPPRSAPFCP